MRINYPITKIARASKCQFFCQNAIGDLTHICFHTSDMHCHIGSKPPSLEKYKTYADFDRTTLT